MTLALLVRALLIQLACCSDSTAPLSHADVGERVGGRADDAGEAYVPQDAAAAANSDSSMGPTASGARIPRPAFCDRRDAPLRATALHRAFCASDVPPAITSLSELQSLLGVTPFAASSEDGRRGNEVVLLGHSTALPGRLVSPINPRAIIVGRDTILAYVRGAQEVELASRASDGSDRLVFYLLRYRQACNTRAAGCSFGELYTPATETDWIAVELFDDSELVNTPADCRICHARATERAVLLMREVDGPWTHFFDALPQGEASNAVPEPKGYDLLRDYLSAKGDERYAGIDLSRYAPSAAQALEIAAGLDQPLYFDSLNIERERWPYHHPDGYPDEPQPSPTWDAAYAAFKRGEQLALPYFAPRPTSPTKQARLSQAYERYRRGELAADALPDLADVFPDEPSERAKIGLETEPDATPADALIQACGPCHNDVLDPSLSRAKFNIDLSRLSQAELDVAVERLERPQTQAGAMPPPGARALTAPVRKRLIAYLRGPARSAKPDPQLAHAAAMGMLGGARPKRP